MKGCPAKAGDYFEFFAEIGLTFKFPETDVVRSLGGSFDLPSRQSGTSPLGSQ
jgi:hypothetical protein